MKTSYAIYTALGLAACAGLSVAWATDSKPTISVVRGSAQVMQADGSWTGSSSVPVGSWLRSSKSDTTVRLPGLTMRLEPGASVRVSHLDGPVAKLDAKGGRVFVKVDAQSSCVVSTATKQVQASQSEFVVDAGAQERLYVLDGQASLVNEAPVAAPLNSWSKAASKTIALDGPDVRQRNRSRNKFTQGEENKGRRIGEDQPPTRTPSPTPSQSPAYSPSPSPRYTPPSPSPTPPPQNNPPPEVGGGGSAWPWIGGALGAGGLAYLLINNNDSNNDFFFVNRPASP